MIKSIITISLMALLTGCVTPVSSSCSQEAHIENPHSATPSKEQKCSEVDAVIYLASALYKEAQKKPAKEKTIEDPTKGSTTCSGLIGKSQKECQRKEEASYDPLDEL